MMKPDAYPRTGDDTKKHELKYFLCATAALIAMSAALTLPALAESALDEERVVTPLFTKTAAQSAPAARENTTPIPATWTAEPAETVARTADNGAAPSAAGKATDDDIVTEIAAAPVAGGELANLRGGFRTPGGLEISVGFDMKTFFNGILKVHNIFNILGTPPSIAKKNTPAAPSTTVARGAGANGGIVPVVVVPLVTPVVQITTPPPETTTTAAATTTPPVTPPVTPPPPAATTTAAAVTPPPATPTVVAPPVPDPIVPVVINEITNGKITLVTEIGDGATKIINEVNGGSANTVVLNTASGISVEQITGLSVGISKPGGFIRSIQIGRQIGVGGDVSNVMRSALIGSLAR